MHQPSASRRIIVGAALLLPIVFSSPRRGCAAAVRSTPEQQMAGAEALRELDIRYENGTQFNLAGFRGRALLINFWAYWCPNCISELKSMEQLQQSLGGPSRLSIVLISDSKYWERDR